MKRCPQTARRCLWTARGTSRSERHFLSTGRISEHMFCSSCIMGRSARRPDAYQHLAIHSPGPVDLGHGRGRPSACVRGARSAAEPRGRGVGARRDDALARRDRRRQRGARRGRLLPREPRQDLPRGARALREGRAGRRDHARRRARGARRARGRRRQGAASTSWRRSSPRPRTPRHYARIVHEMATLRGLDPRRLRDPAARLRAPRRDDRPRRPRRAADLRDRPGTGSRASSRTSSRCSRRASSGSRSSTRRASTSPARRPASATSTS